MNECTGCFDPNCGSDKPLTVKSTDGRMGRLVDVKVILMSDLQDSDKPLRGEYKTVIEYTVTYHESHIPKPGDTIWIGNDSSYEVAEIASGLYPYINPSESDHGFADGYLEIIACRDEP